MTEIKKILADADTEGVQIDPVTRSMVEMAATARDTEMAEERLMEEIEQGRQDRSETLAEQLERIERDNDTDYAAIAERARS